MHPTGFGVCGSGFFWGGGGGSCIEEKMTEY